MELTTEAIIKQIVEIKDKDTDEVTYYMADEDKWIQITAAEYQKLIGEDEDGE